MFGEKNKDFSFLNAHIIWSTAVSLFAATVQIVDCNWFWMKYCNQIDNTNDVITLIISVTLILEITLAAKKMKFLIICCLLR